MNGMKNFSTNRKSAAFLKNLGAVVLLFLFLFVLNIFGPQIKNYFHLTSYPFEKTFWSAGQSASGLLGYFFSSHSISAENKTLKDENFKLLSEILSLRSEKLAREAQENILLRTANAQNLTFIMAEAMGMEEPDIITINKGLKDGILEGMPVVGEKNSFFGKILKVYENFSTVMTISHKDSIVSVKILRSEENESENQIYGLLKGLGSKNALLDLVPIDQEVKKGDILITSSLENIAPKNTLIGRVSDIKKNDQNPYQQAEVELFLDINSEHLFVITNYKQ